MFAAIKASRCRRGLRLRPKISVFQGIKITLHLEAKTKEKGERILARFREVFGRPVSVQSFERNVDDNSLFRVDLITPLETDNIEHAVFKSLEVCATFARSWLIVGPDKVNGGNWEFSGWARDAQLIVPGIRAACFEIGSNDDE